MKDEPFRAGAPRAHPGPETVRGIGWATNVGWGVAALGLLIVFYSYNYAATTGSNYNPAGISGSKIGSAIAFLGLVAGFLFIFYPPAHPSGFDPRAGPSTWSAHKDASAYMERASRIISWVGVGLVMLGLVLANYVYSLYARAPSTQTEVAIAGQSMPFTTWAAVFLGLSVLGGFLWAVFWTRANAYRYAGQGFHVAALSSGMPAQPMMAPAPSGGASGLPPDVRSDQLAALMRKLDAMLATLPEDQVAAFSKSPEAETYLKLLSQRGSEPTTSAGSSEGSAKV